MRNNLAALNNYLFEQLERLQDDELDEDALRTEIRRADAVCKVAGAIIDGGHLMMMAAQYKMDRRPEDALPALLEGDK